MAKEQCSRIREFLETSTASGVVSLPADLRSHARGCPACGLLLQNLEAVRREFDRNNIDGPHLALAREHVLKRIGTVSPGAPPALGIWLFPGFKWAVGLVGVIATLVVFLWPGGSTDHSLGVVPEPAASILVRGLPGRLIPPAGEPLAVTPEGVTAGSATRLVFGPQASITVDLPRSGRVMLAGAGDLVLDEQGFSCDTGSFTARFQRLRQPFLVRAPQVVLGVRGTTIAFQLQAGEGELRLLEGEVEVTLPGSDLKTVRWRPGEVLHVRGKHVSLQAPALRIASATPAPVAIKKPPATGTVIPVSPPVVEPPSVTMPVSDPVDGQGDPGDSDPVPVDFPDSTESSGQHTFGVSGS